MTWKLGIGFGIALLVALCAGEAAADVRSQGPQAFFVQQQEALADSIAAREHQLASARREIVAERVARRAREMSVTAPADLLTDLLFDAAEARLELDRCTLSGALAEECKVWQTELDGIESRFRDQTGLTMAAFRSGGYQTGETELSSISAAAESSCLCSFSVYSSDRWMNGYWGLECGGHGSHGVCWAIPGQDTVLHSAGCGAMTGDVAVSTGLQWHGRECADDHQTCFKGPGFCGSGEWSAVCSCDTWHWPGKSGGEASAELVYQFTYQNVALNGYCGQAQFQVIEGINEHDPICCDDWMGNLVATFTPPAGDFDLSVPASATKCGSSGVCGSFGARVRVMGFCSGPTPPPPPDGGGGGGGGGGCGSHNMVCYPSYKACAAECCGVCERRINCGSETAHKCFE